MNLKPLRARIGLTQKDLADRLGTTQQTIARWESGTNPIPTKHLKDLAVLLGCSVSSLLSVDNTGLFKRADSAGATGHEDDDLPYGSVRLTFDDATHKTVDSNSHDKPSLHSWPISETARSRLIAQLHERSGFGGEDGSKGWLNFETMDDRFVLVNPACLESIELASDDEEAAPPREHAEVYSAINLVLAGRVPPAEQLDAETSSVSRQLIDRAKDVIEQWGGMDHARVRMTELVIEKASGKRSSLSIDDDNATDILFGLLTDDRTCADHRFGNLTSQGYETATYFRYGSLRLIELSKLRWDDLMDDESDQEDSDADGAIAAMLGKAAQVVEPVSIQKRGTKKH